jgi:hypothetical protein
MLDWLKRIVIRKRLEAKKVLCPENCMVRVDSGAVRIAVRGTEWCSVNTMLSAPVDKIVLEKCEDGKWYSLAELGIEVE